MWDVLTLFLIPIGGGIPGGVLLARARGFDWPMMMFLYFISDVILALLFEPMLKLFIFVTRNSPRLKLATELFSKAVRQSIARYGVNPSPFSLIMISFGVDPMTGRAAARAAGHGFVSGWAIAIAGDMIYFTVLMISTLWLSHILGDGTWTVAIILVAMIGIPYVWRKLRPILTWT